MSPFLFLVAAYLLGSIPFGYLIGRWIKGVDIRRHGSQNIGATNVFRVVGKKWGILVFILDALKGALGVLLPQLFGVRFPAPFLLGLAVAAISGHTFTLWLGFKGGKGVATSFGVFVSLCPLPALVAFGIFLLFFLSTRILSVGSLAAALGFPVCIALFYRSRDSFVWFFGVSLLLLVFILYTHRKNISRLLRGEEKRLF